MQGSSREARSLRADPELVRLAIALHQAPLIRLWLIAREITRKADGSGKVAKSALRAALSRFQIAYYKQHFYRLLKAGDGRYWDISGQYIFLKGYKQLATTLSLLAEQEDSRLVATNRPGVPDVYLKLSGTLEEFEANSYSAWLYYRDYPTIARETLSLLFGRTPETIRRWESEQLSQTVSKRANYAQCADLSDYPYPIPFHANSYVAQVGKKRVVRVSWQLPNTYFTKGIKQHRHRGQSAKVRRTVNAVLNPVLNASLRDNQPLNPERQQPANLWRGGLLRCQLSFNKQPFDKQSFNRKLYFNSPSKLERYIKLHGGVGYLWLDENPYGHGMFDVTTSGRAQTQARERESFWTERALLQSGGLKLTL